MLLNNSKESEIMRCNLWIFVRNGLIICYVRWIRTVMEQMFSKICEKKVEEKVKRSILRDGKSCIYEITVL